MDKFKLILITKKSNLLYITSFTSCFYRIKILNRSIAIDAFFYCLILLRCFQTLIPILLSFFKASILCKPIL